jgi:hypothetical protein
VPRLSGQMRLGRVAAVARWCLLNRDPRVGGQPAGDQVILCQVATRVSPCHWTWLGQALASVGATAHVNFRHQESVVSVGTMSFVAGVRWQPSVQGAELRCGDMPSTKTRAPGPSSGVKSCSSAVARRTRLGHTHSLEPGRGVMCGGTSATPCGTDRFRILQTPLSGWNRFSAP